MGDVARNPSLLPIIDARTYNKLLGIVGKRGGGKGERFVIFTFPNKDESFFPQECKKTFAHRSNVSHLQADSRVKARDFPNELNSTLIHIDSKILPRYAIASGVV
ncbi:MAG: hypothetical protein RMY64_05575 [Nostoc sp. DedQUE08]|nr:hypothetical protein [Nostoc sp. DedQUE08]